MYHSINELVKEGDLQKIKNFVNGNELKGNKLIYQKKEIAAKLKNYGWISGKNEL